MSRTRAKSSKKRIANAVGAIVTTCAISLSVLITPKVVLAKETGCSLSDIVSYCSFEQELKEIKQERNIVFHNSELYNILKEKAGGKLTVEFLQSITTLVIAEPLANNDLSDLKYLPNLSVLEISGMNVDCKDLIYNQNLKVFNCLYGGISNLNDLPNNINALHLQGTTFSDGIVYVPYNTNTLELNNSTFNKIQFKNPEELISFTFKGYALLDINDLKDCSNLSCISLTTCPNVANSQLLSKFPNLKSIDLDDYSCIWLNQDTLSKINLNSNTKKIFSSYIERLDQIINDITKDCKTEEEKINAIIIYITNQIEYDIRVSAQENGYDSLVNEYNELPIYYALNSADGICVNYACLFTALANKIGIDNYQPRSASHTWNMVRLDNEPEYKAYDIGGLDGQAYITYPDGSTCLSDQDTSLFLENNATESLFYYAFDIDDINSESYETIIKPRLISNISKTIGYMKLNGVEALKSQLFVLSAELIALSIALNIKIHTDKKEDTKSVKTFKYKRV